ncbi:MAG: dTDP-4-dehydrorhamnose reductase [Verrucomicrobiaceae bacterium]|nr:MAG: dTDP-4-dehydrorhamnose reductase [Verrucomicrobiaceae bacterium]
MKILLFGKNGQVGWELQRSLAPLGQLVALSSASREMCGNLRDPAGIAQTVRSLAPDVIVNAAAHTAVDKAESEPELAEALNARAPGLLADEALRCGALLVHYSTDYVFDGSGSRPWTETDATGPLGVYGRTKLDGESAMKNSGCKYLIFRTSWVYAARGKNFAKTILKLAGEREKLTVIADQIGAPTGAELLADVTALAVRQAWSEPGVSGIYHLAAGGETSWHGYATFVCEFARQAGVELRAQTIEPVPSSAFPTPARRPLNSRLDTSRLCGTFDLQLPLWQTGVERMVQEIFPEKL